MNEQQENPELSEELTETKTKPLLPAEARDRVMALGMICLAFLTCLTFPVFTHPGNYGGGVAVTAILFGLSILIYGRRKTQKLSAECYFWLAIMIISAGTYMFVYHQSLMWFHSVFLRLVMMYMVLVMLRALVADRTGEFVLFDGINMLFLIPLRNLDAQWRIAAQEIKKMKFVSALIKGVLGLLVALPLLLLVITLLADADEQFGTLLIKTMYQLGDDFFRYIRTFLLSLPVGCFLFGLIYGSANRRGTDSIKPEWVRNLCAACAVIPIASIGAVLFAVCALYVLFIWLQSGYYISVMKGILPNGFTYSQYARQGFFELVKVSLINLGILMAARLFCRTRGIVLKGFYLLLSVLTLFLIGTAMTKMMMYIDVYGLTPLRVIPSVFMIFLAFIFVLIIISQFKPLPIVRISLFVFAAGYMVFSAANMDGRIAGYNLSRYQAGTLEEFPERVLLDGSLASIPAMYQVWQSTERESLKSELSVLASRIANNERGVIRDAKAWRNVSKEKNTAIKYIEIMTK